MPNDETATVSSSGKNLHSRLLICVLAQENSLVDELKNLLREDRYQLVHKSSATELCQFVQQNWQDVDCLIWHPSQLGNKEMQILSESNILLPIVIIEPERISSTSQETSEINEQGYLYHKAEIHLEKIEQSQITFYIDQALTKFLKLAPYNSLPNSSKNTNNSNSQTTQDALLSRQKQLIEKLKERLGYLGVYYKRNPQHFFRKLSSTEKKKLLIQLNREYRQIILDYFSQGNNVNQAIDQFVNQAFFADLSVSQVVEIHMELMEEFAQQLKLEGRSEDILLDYRLTLIDIIAHLCEMYRRSIPREDISLEP